MRGGKSSLRFWLFVYLVILSILLSLVCVEELTAISEEELVTALTEVLEKFESGTEKLNQALLQLQKQFDLTEKELMRLVNKALTDTEKAGKELDSLEKSFTEYKKRASQEIDFLKKENAGLRIQSGVAVGIGVLTLIASIVISIVK